MGLESRIALMDKQLRIRKLNHDELKQISKKESEDHIDCLRKTERLLSQQQELTETSNKENVLLKEEINNLTCKFDDLNKKSQKQLVEFSIREDKILEQTSSLQRIIEGKEITIC